jgi:hypothetical protein
MNRRIPFMILAVVNLLAGIWAGLLRIGWELPVSEVAVHHGALMVGGFLTTLIALEKVIPLKISYFFAVPVVSALSLLMVVPGFHQAGIILMMMGGAGLLITQLTYMYRHPHDLSVWLMAAGAACLLVGEAMLFKKQFYPAAFPWWMGFLVFTITAERLELTKFLPVTAQARRALMAFLFAFIAGLIFPFHQVGNYISGFSMIAIALWMLRHDVISVGLRKEGLTRFSAASLLAANCWLILAGFLLVLQPETIYTYDMLVHTFFIGYVFSMIFAHGPIILPGVLGVSVKPFHGVLYVWPVLLNLSLVIRIIADTTPVIFWREVSGLFSAAAILFYFVMLIVLTVRQMKHAAIR